MLFIALYFLVGLACAVILTIPITRIWVGRDWRRPTADEFQHVFVTLIFWWAPLAIYQLGAALLKGIGKLLYRIDRGF